jgi:uncharacterized protein
MQARQQGPVRSCTMTSEDLQRHRDERDRFLAEHFASPLSEEDQATFVGLDYFPEDPSLDLRAPFRALSGTRELAHSTGSPRHYHLVGAVDVSIGDQTFTMTVLDGGDGNPFLPFRDTTSDTYEGGRYVPVTIHDGTASVNFNLAANPWCAYDEEFACPLPPPENVLPLPVRAGEKRFR